MSNSHAGRRSSWIAVVVIFVGFCVGGFAVTQGPNWVLFGAGAVIAAVGGILALLVDIMTDVVVDQPR